MAIEHNWINEHDHHGAVDLLRAVKLAFKVHSGQTDKVGNPYFSHCKRVADSVEGDDRRIVAYLHDIIEKGEGWTLDRLRREGFSEEVVDAVDALTHREREDEDAFVRRAIENPIARLVKAADLKDNLQQAQSVGADTGKYEKGLEIIERAASDRL